MTNEAQDIKGSRNWRYVVLIFAIWTANELGWHLTGGEEQYLAFSRQFIDSSWIQNSFTLAEFPGTRIAFQLFFGTLLQVLDFESVAILGRCISYLGISIPLAAIFSRLNMSYAAILIAVQAFVMSEQSFFGGEWIAKGFEPKTIAYIFVFLGLNEYLKGRLSRSAVAFAAATYIHFLVGGWSFAAVLMALWLTRTKWLKTFFLPFVALILPFVIYLYSGYFSTPSVTTDYNLDWVYGYFRLPHHIGIFATDQYFIERHLLGVCISAIVLAFSILFRKYFTGPSRQLNLLLTISLSINILFVGIAWLDAHVLDYGAGFIMKFYPFRLNSLAMFLSIILFTKTIVDWLLTQQFAKHAIRGLILLFVILGIFQAINNVKHNLRTRISQDFVELCSHIRQHESTSAVFALVNMGRDNDTYNAFIRLSERECFSVFKFVPGEKLKLNVWYKRQLDLASVNEGADNPEVLNEKWGVTRVISPVPITGLQEVYSFGQYKLYAID